MNVRMDVDVGTMEEPSFVANKCMFPMSAHKNFQVKLRPDQQIYARSVLK